MDIEADLKPTEDPEKLIKHIKKVIPSAELEQEEGKSTLRGEGEFEDLWRRAGEKKIKNTVLDTLKENKAGKKHFLDLDKVSASQGRLSIYSKSSLGKIRIYSTMEEIEQSTKGDPEVNS